MVDLLESLLGTDAAKYYTYGTIILTLIFIVLKFFVKLAMKLIIRIIMIVGSIILCIGVINYLL